MVPGEHMSDRPLEVQAEALASIGRSLEVDLDLDLERLREWFACVDEIFADFDEKIVLTGLDGFEETDQ
jgi:hypothetical protein